MDTFGVTFTSNCTVTLEVRASNLDDAIKRAEKEARRIFDQMQMQHEPGPRIEFGEITRYDRRKTSKL